jgi:hypothetical protein
MLNAWLKYVYNQRANNSKTGAYTITKTHFPMFYPVANCLQRQFINHPSNLSSTTLSTHQNTKYNLLNKSFTLYPQGLLLRLLNEN